MGRADGDWVGKLGWDDMMIMMMMIMMLGFFCARSRRLDWWADGAASGEWPMISRLQSTNIEREHAKDVSQSYSTYESNSSPMHAVQ